MAIPDFIGIGVPRAGTSWASVMLDEHPSLYIPPVKETYYFSRFVDRSVEWYQSLFGQVPPDVKVGEFTTDYFMFPGMVPQAKAINPHVKFIIVLRDPVERAFSHYLYRKRNGLEKGSLREAIQSRSFIIEMGFYAKYLRQFLAAAEQDAVYICLYEDLRDDPVTVMQSMYKFLDVDPAFMPSTRRQYVNSIEQNSFRSPFVQSLFIKSIQLRHYRAFRWLDISSRSTVRPTFLSRLRDFNRKIILVPKEHLGDQERVLLQDIYREDIAELKTLLGRSLKKWQF